MIKFKTDENLGMTVKKFTAWSFGWEPIKELWDLRFAAGGNKFSQLCTFKFESALPDIEYPTFSIAFVAKLRSKIFHSQAKNASQWYIFKKISPMRTDVLTKEQLFVNYGFDIDKFFNSDVFKAMIEKFKHFVKNGLDVEIPKFAATLKNSDDLREVERFKKSISEALPLIETKRVNNVYYKLLLNPDLDESELDAKIEEEFKNKGIYVDLQLESTVPNAQQQAWTQMWKKWITPRTTGDIFDDMSEAIPDWKDRVHEILYGHPNARHEEDFDNAVTAVLDDVNPETHQPFWDECKTFDGFLRAIEYVVDNDLHTFKESESDQCSENNDEENRVDETSFDQFDWKDRSLTGNGVKQAIDAFKAQDAEKQPVAIYDRAADKFYAIVDAAMASRHSGWGLVFDIDTRKTYENSTQIDEANTKELAQYVKSCNVFADEIVPDILKNKSVIELIAHYGEDEATNKEVGLAWVICALAEVLKKSKNKDNSNFGAKIAQVGAAFML